MSDSSISDTDNPGADSSGVVSSGEAPANSGGIAIPDVVDSEEAQPNSGETAANSGEGGDSSNGETPGGSTFGDDIQPTELVEEVKDSFLEYALSVIISRALPDARDGLKPVHRRILWSMSESGLRPDRGHVKCATVVGDVIAKYHPHGDTAVYDALVRMGQNFSLRHMLVDPHGNFGSPGDRPAAYRYTECRLSRLATHMMDGIHEETVDFNSNFDGRHNEPIVLPSRFPNLLVNGSQGIAVGMATNIPPHNLSEVIDAVIHLLRDPDASAEALLGHIQGPDFPTGGLIMGKKGIQDTYLSGRGSIKLRARTEIEEVEDSHRIVVTEMPYQVSVESIGAKVQQLVDKKNSNQELLDIKEMRDESAKGKTRLVFDLKKGANPGVVLNNLFKNTRLQTSFPANMVALDNGIPRTMTLRQLLTAYASHQIEVVTKRSEFRLDKAQKRAHILEGLLRAADIIDEIIAAIRASEDTAAARQVLMAEPFEFSEIQTEHILEMPLRRLTRIASQELNEEYQAKQAEIAELTEILSDEQRLRSLIIEELTEIKDEFSQPRRSELSNDPGFLDPEDLIDDDMVVFVMSTEGYVKCVLAEEFRTQGRGGGGVKVASVNEDDDIKKIIHTSAHSYLLFFSNFGRAFRVKAYEMPFMRRESKGTPLVNFFELGQDERIDEVIDTRDYETNPYLLFVTQKGQVKKSLFTQYDSTYKGLKALTLIEGDELVKVMPVKQDEEVMLVTKRGRAIRFSLDEVRSTGRPSSGVKGIRLRPGDAVVDAVVVDAEGHLVIASSKGYAKRVEFKEFNRRHRGGYGVKCFGMRDDRGEVVGALSATADFEFLLVSNTGKILRTRVSGLSIQGRTASGVITMRFRDGSVDDELEAEESSDFVKDITPTPALEDELDLDEIPSLPAADDSGGSDPGEVPPLPAPDDSGGTDSSDS